VAIWAARCWCPPSQFIRKLTAARLAADVMGVPTVLVARTDADSAELLTSDVDERDQPFLTAARAPPRVLHGIKGGLESAIARALAYAPYADVMWCETSRQTWPKPSEFAEAVHEKFPGKLLAYNCSPVSFNWKKHLR
jgi:isocitrate lyase